MSEQTTIMYKFTMPHFVLYSLQYGELCETDQDESIVNDYEYEIAELVHKHNGSHYTIEHLDTNYDTQECYVNIHIFNKGASHE